MYAGFVFMCESAPFVGLVGVAGLKNRVETWLTCNKLGLNYTWFRNEGQRVSKLDSIQIVFYP